MYASRRLFPCLNVLTLVSLLLTYVPVQAQAPPAQYEYDVFPDTSETRPVPVQQADDSTILTLKAVHMHIPADGASEATIWAKASDEEGHLVPDGTALTASTSLGRLAEERATTRDGVARFTLVAGQETGTAIATVRAGDVVRRVAVEFVSPDEMGTRISEIPDVPPFDPDERAEVARHPVSIDRTGVARAEGESYTARFDGERLSFILQEETALGFTLMNVRVGRQVLFVREGERGQVEARENRASAERAPDFQEEYAALDGGVKQSFILRRPLVPRGGHLVIEGEFDTFLEPRYLSDEEGIVFLDREGRELLAYTGALVCDALGREIVAQLELEGKRVRLTVPGAWLAGAEYPVVVDPMIGDVVLVSGGANYSGQPAVAYNSDDDEWLVVWKDNRNGGQYDVYGQRVRPDGTLAGGNFAIVTASGFQKHPDVAYSSAAGQYLVVWEDYRDDNWDVYGRRVTAGGVVTGSEITVAVASGSQMLPAVAYQPATEEWLVVWNGGQAQGQRVSASGELVGADFLVSQNSIKDGPDVAANSENGEYLVVWYQKEDIDEYQVRARRVLTDGTLLGSELVLSPADNLAGYPQVAYNAKDSEYLVVWKDYRNGNWDIYGQRVSADGVLTGGNFAISSLAGDETYPSITWDGRSGRYLVGWQGRGLGQRVWADGTLDGGPIDPSASVGAPDHAYGLVSGIVLGVGEAYGCVLAGRYAIPVADFSATPLAGDAPLTVTFTNLSTPLYGTTGYIWTFGDGATSTLTEPMHVYTGTGLYTVTLTVEVEEEETHTLTRTNYITVTSGGVAAPVADFTASPLSGAAPLIVTFTNTTTGDVTGYEWAFGDGATSVITHPTHIYTTTGVYTVSLTATGPGGSDTLTRSNYIAVTEATPPPVADFTGAPSSGYAPLTVTFTNSTTGDVTGYEWDFGDGGASLEENPTHVYAAGVYTVSLRATGPGGSDTLTRPAYIEAVVNQAPVVTITVPSEGAVITSGGIQVSGIVVDDGTVVSVLINDVPATVVGDTFSATVALESGNQVINVIAEDDQGALGFADRVVRVDGEGPLVTIHTPRDRQAVYTLYPSATVSYTDFYTNVDTATFDAQLTDEGGAVADVSGDFSVGDTGASGTLGPLDEGIVYTLTVSITDVHGHAGSDSNVFYVPSDPGSITPPDEYEGTGWVSGVVYDSDTCDEHLTTCRGLAGVRVTVVSIDHETRETTDDVEGTVVTGPDGFFAFPIDETGTYAPRFEKDGYTYGQREVAVVRQRSTVVNDVYLTPLDPATTPCDSSGCHHVSGDGLIQVDIPPGAVVTGETITVTATNFEHVEFLPSGGLPPGTWETYAFNLGGDSEVQFTRAITVRLQNYRDFDPGTRIPLGYWNQTALQWEHAGVGVVDESGGWLVMHVDHFSNWDCNDPITLPSMGIGIGDLTDEDDLCPAGESGCAITLKSGQVREWIDLPAVNVLGRPAAPTIAYDTNRANPSEVIDLRLDLDFDPQVVEVGNYVQCELYIEGQKSDSFTFEAHPDGDGEVGRYRYLWDGRNALGERLPPGVYEYAVKMSVPYTTQYYWALNNRFGGPPDPDQPTGVFVEATRDYWTYGTIALNSQPDSALGSGWILDGRQQLTEDEAGRIVVAEGNQLSEYYFELVDQLDGLAQYGAAEPPVTGPAAEVVFPPLPEASTEVSGAITADATWTQAGSPYVVTGGNVVVTDGVTLTIEPGVSVMLDQYQSLIVEGGLQAVGTPTAPITFAAYTDGSYEAWLTYTIPSDLRFYGVESVAVDAQGNVWFGGYDDGDPGMAVIARLHSDLETWEAYELPQEMYAYHVYDIAADVEGRVWFATDDGVAELSADGATWTVYKEEDGLLSNYVYAVAVDNAAGHVWFGTHSGANRFIPATGEWESYTTADGLVDNEVHSLAVDDDGSVWFGTEPGLSKRTVEGVWTTYITDENVSDIAFDHDGNTWLVVPSGGIRVLLAGGDWMTCTTSTSELVSNDVSSIAVDEENRKWIGYEQDGVSFLSSDNLVWFHETEPRLSDNMVGDIATSPDGAVWVGTYDSYDDDAGASATRIYEDVYRSGTISGGYWGYVQIGGGSNLDDSSGSHLSHVIVESGGIADSRSLYLYHSAPTLDNLTIRGSGGDGLYAQESGGFTLDTATVEGNEGNGVHVQGGGGGHSLTGVTSQYNNGHGLYLEHVGQITVTEATLAHNFGYGIFSQDDDTSLVVRDSSIAHNEVAARLPAGTASENNTWSENEHNQIEWAGGTIPADRTWDDGVEAYVVIGDVAVSDGVTLTIPAGTTVLFDHDCELYVRGALWAVGTVDEPITLGRTGYYRWDGLVVGGGSVAGDSDSSHLSYVIVDGAYYGLYLSQSTPTLDHLSLVGNRYGLYVSNSSGVTIHDSNFAGNYYYGIYNATPAQEVVATGNFWNAVTGPRTGSSGPGDRVSNGVAFDPWLAKPLFIAGVNYILSNRSPTDHTTLAYNADTDTYTRYYPDGREVHFDGQGRHDYTLSPDGRKTVYTYNSDGTVATMHITATGVITPWMWTFDYDENGNLAQITDPAGRTTGFAVDDNGHLAQVAFPDGSSRQFYYDGRGLLTQQVDGEGNTTGYVYDDYGRLTEHTGPSRAVYDAATGQMEATQEVRAFTPSDTAYPLINESPAGDPDDPAPAVITSTLLVDGVVYGRGGRSGHTNEWGNWLDESDGLGRTSAYERDEANNLTNLAWPSGECVDATYDENGNLLTVARMGADQCELLPGLRDPTQVQTSTLTYEPRFNQVKTQTDPLGNTTTYYYDYELDLGEAGKLVRVEYPPVNDGTGQIVTPTVTYTYNDWGLLETETDARGTVTRYVYTQGTADEAADGANPLFAPGVTPVPGLLTQVIRDDGGFNLTTVYEDFNGLGNPMTVIAPGGQMTMTYTYDQLGRTLSATNAEGITTLYEYDGRGQLTRKVVDYTADGTTGRNVVTEYEYDAEGRQVGERTEASGLVVETSYLYDVNGQLVGERDGLGHETCYVYDDADQLVNVVDPAGHVITNTYTLDGRLERATDAEGTVTRYVYDDLGRLVTEIQDEGGLDLTTVYTYDLSNNLVATVAPDGTVTCYEYDSLNRSTAEIRDCGGLDLTTRYAYDLNGNTVYITDTRGIVTYHEYDALGRVTLTRQDDGGLNLETRNEYDDAGNLAVITDTRGTVTTLTYDELNRLVQRCADTAGLNLCTGYGYDRLGNQTVITDAGGVVERTVYNDLGLPQQVIEDDGGLNATTTLGYDAALNLVSVVDANGNGSHYTYTPRGAVAAEIYADGTSVAYEYDPRGNLAVLTLQDDRTITHAYDALGRLTGKTFSTGGWQSLSYDALGRMTSAEQTLDGHETALTYAYNRLGDVVSTTQALDGSGWQVDYGYDYASGVLTVTYPSGAQRVQALDPLNRLDSVREGSGGLVADYDYHDLDFYNTLAYPNGLTTRTDYDTLGRTTQISSTVAGYAYGYDAVGNRTYVQRLHRPGQPADVYQYDALYQLTQVWYGADSTDPGSITSYDHLQWYDLDSLGNRLEVQNDGLSEFYLPNDGAQLTDPMNRYEQVAGSALTYDPRGNTLSDGVNTYTYDVLNRQTVVTGTSSTAEYLYDARGRRVAKVTGGITTTHFIYDTQYRVIEERDEGGALLARYTYGAGMDEPLTMERGGQTYYYHRDGLGSITEVTNETGTLVERYEYDVYGAATIFDGSGITLTASAIGNPYLFTGRRYDPESGNYYYRARMYSPRLGRFLSQDPLGFDAGDYNLYRYAFNNPTNLTDPTGEITPDTVLDVIFIAVDVVMIGTDVYRLVTNDECDKSDLYWALGIDLAALGLDILFAIIPVATGGGPGLRLAAASAHGGSVAVDAVRVARVTEELLRRGTQIAVKGVQLGKNVWLSKATDGSGGSGEGGRPRNRGGVPYPRHTVKGYGEVPFPNGEIKVTDPKPLRKQFRGIKVEFRKWWYNKYGWFPSPDIYDIHHIKPLSRGGTNDFDNLVPVKRGPDHDRFTTWWKKYP